MAISTPPRKLVSDEERVPVFDADGLEQLLLDQAFAIPVVVLPAGLIEDALCVDARDLHSDRRVRIVTRNLDLANVTSPFPDTPKHFARFSMRDRRPDCAVIQRRQSRGRQCLEGLNFWDECSQKQRLDDTVVG